MTSLAHNTSRAEFQAIVLAGGPGSRLDPLVAGLPKSLLPVANRPLLYYQLRMLEKAGFVDVIVVTSVENSSDVSSFLSEYQGKLNIDIVRTKETEGTADVLRQIKDKIVTDFLLVSADLISEASISDLADIHRKKDSTVTMLYKELSSDPVERKKAKKASNGIIDYVGIVEEEKRSRSPRVVFLQTGLPDEPIEISKSLLKREPRVSINTCLQDAHLYIFKRWIVDILEEKKKISSIRLDLLPYLVNLQYRGVEALPESVQDSTTEELELAQSMSANQCKVPRSTDAIRCFAMVSPLKGAYIARANNLNSYMTVNHEVAHGSIAATTPWEKPESKTEKKLKGCLVDEACEFGEKAQIKNCIIGKHCKIGVKARLNNCILMDFVSVGNGSIIQNSVLCNNSVIHEGCNLNDCQVASGAIVAEDSELKSEMVYSHDKEAFIALGEDAIEIDNVVFE